MALFIVATGLGQANVKWLEWACENMKQRHAWIAGDRHRNGKPHSAPLNEIALYVLRKQLGKHRAKVFTAWLTAIARQTA